MQSNISENSLFPLHLDILQDLRRRLLDPQFLNRHRRRPKDFVRERSLPFQVVLLLILQKTTRSLQVHLHDFLARWENSIPPAITAGALTRARAKLRPQAYAELNSQSLLSKVYARENASALRLWHGHRMLAIDSSLIRLPATRQLFKLFGRVDCGNKKGLSSVSYAPARVSVLYDVLNDLGWDARLDLHTVAETEQAQQHLGHVLPGDVVITDRGYTGYYWFALMIQMRIEFVARCSLGSFTAVQQLFKEDKPGVSREVILSAPNSAKTQLRKAGLPLSIRVRFVTLRLSTGELEVLATSLLDQERYPTSQFGEVYHMRWGIETYYGRLKGRLELENWSGKTEHAIRQDFHAAVFLSNLESLLCRDCQMELTQKTSHREQPAQINRAVSLNTLKTWIIELLASNTPLPKLVGSLKRLFIANPVSVRSNRKVPRRKTPSGQAYHYQRNVRKVVF